MPVFSQNELNLPALDKYLLGISGSIPMPICSHLECTQTQCVATLSSFIYKWKERDKEIFSAWFVILENHIDMG